MIGKVIYSIISIIVLALVYPVPNIQEVNFTEEIVVQLIYYALLMLVIFYLIWGTKLGDYVNKVIEKSFIPNADNHLSDEYYQWIYVVRGLAIIAVVVCHQQYFLHSTEWLQMFSLYSVTSFIFCMGLTKWLSVSKYLSQTTNICWKGYIGDSIKKILWEYLLVTMLYLTIAQNFSYLNTWNAMLQFNASGPLYFVAYVIWYSIFGPFLCLWLKYRSGGNGSLIIGLMGIYIVSYIELSTANIFGGSYLLVYVLGMLCSKHGFYKVKKRHVLLAIIFWGFSALLLYDFYFNGYIGGDSSIFTDLINFLIPKLNFNPPNNTILIYSFASINLFYVLFEKTKHFKGIKWLHHILTQLGKYSLDIFMWHIMIQRFWVLYGGGVSNIWLKRILAYFTMLMLPVFGRQLFEIMKNKVKYLSFHREAENGGKESPRT